MVDTKSCDYSNSGHWSEFKYSGLFFGTDPSPTQNNLTYENPLIHITEDKIRKYNQIIRCIIFVSVNSKKQHSTRGSPMPPKGGLCRQQ